LVQRITGLSKHVTILSWSPDGRYLAAGLGDKGGIHVFSSGSYALVGTDTDYGDRVGGLGFSQDGRLAASSDDGLLRLYKIDADNMQLLAKKAAPGGKEPHAVHFSPDGSTLAVGFRDAPNVSLLSGVTLDFVAAPKLAGLKGRDLKSVAWSADGQTLYAGGWAESKGLNGQALTLVPQEKSRSAAVAPDRESLVLGTGWNLRRFDRTGRQLWRTAAQGEVWAVNISADGRLVVAAYGDGTIRWHRMSDGKPLAAFSPIPTASAGCGGRPLATMTPAPVRRT